MMNISAKGTRVSIETGSVGGYNVDNTSLTFFRPTQGVYIYHLKLVNSFFLCDPVSGLSVKPMNPT